MKTNTEKALHFIKHNNLIGLRAGTQRQTFLDIWMVVVEGRIFARSWGLAERSWYNTFLEEPIGAIKCNEDIFPIQAVIPNDNELLKEKINLAYLTKYNSEHNIPYAKGIIADQHVERTMEFIIQD